MATSPTRPARPAPRALTGLRAGVPAGALVLAATVPTLAAVQHDGWFPAGPFLLLQVMVTLAGALLWWGGGLRGNAVRLLLAGVCLGASNLDSGWAPDGVGSLLQVEWTLQWSAAPLIATVLLAYPEDRLRGRGLRLLVGLLWFWAVGLRVVSSLLWDPVAAGAEDPVRWVHVVTAVEASLWVERASGAVLAPLVVWFVVVQVSRWRRARGASRPTVVLVALAGVLLALGQLLRVGLGYVAWTGMFTVPAGEAAAEWVAGVQGISGALAGGALVAVAVRAAAHRGVVVERLLGAGGDPRAVEAVLQDVLADPTLRLRVAVGRGWVGVDGRPGGAPGDGRTVQVLLRAQDGRAVVEVDAEDHVLRDPAMLRVTLAAAAVVVHNARLTMERQAHLEEVSASRARIVEAGVAQRRQLERDLHDGAQQSLLAVSASLSRATLAPDTDRMRAAVDHARAGLTAALAEVRGLARGIHPAALSQGGLASGLRALAAGSDDVLLELDAGVAGGRRFPAAVESTAYFVVAELVANAVRHAGGRARVRVVAGPDTLSVTVEDDGAGGATVRPGGGLAGLEDRVRALGGVLAVDSPAGGGTTVHALLPAGPAVA